MLHDTKSIQFFMLPSKNCNVFSALIVVRLCKEDFVVLYDVIMLY